MTSSAVVTGIVLAAGAGTRAGGPKALRHEPSGESWLALATTVLIEGGCAHVIVVLGAAAQEARLLVPAQATVVISDWRRGLSESLKSGLSAASGDAALITLVDLPGMPAQVVCRVLEGDGELRQAFFSGRPGHPVYVSRDHWASLAGSLDGDIGARPFLSAHAATEIECGDLWHGLDKDFPN